MLDLIVRNSMIATATDSYLCDIGILNGKIFVISESSLIMPTKEVIDAKGSIVTPGGVDAHCHLDQQMEGPALMADNFFSGSRSAACGGTTTIIPFAAQLKGQSLKQAIEDYHTRATGKSSVDYAFHIIITDPTKHVLEKEVPLLVKDGYTSLKVYMTYNDLKINDYQMLSVLDVAKRTGALVMIHAENSDAIAYLTDRLLELGRTEPIHHADSRPMIVEREATYRAISLSELINVPVYIVHVSGAETIHQLRLAKNNGIKVYAETCPQYLFLSQEDLGASDFCGAKFICSPPPRDKSNQLEVWNALSSGLFDAFSSDHAPYNFDSPLGKKLSGTHPSFNNIPNGVPGIETRLALLYSDGVMSGKITLQQFVALTSTNPAKLFGLYPRKGTIAVGSDADLVIWNTTRDFVLHNDWLHHAVDYTPYDGHLMHAWPSTTILRGSIIYQNNSFRGYPGSGEFLRCGKPILE